MKLRLLTILTILAVGLTLGADQPQKDEAAKDLDRVQGAWVLVSSEANGVKADLEEAGITGLQGREVHREAEQRRNGGDLQAAADGALDDLDASFAQQ